MSFDLLPYLPPSFDLPAFVSLLTISLLLIFVGRRLIQGIAFVLVGLIGGLIGLTVGSTYLGLPGALAGFVTGFLLGGLASVLVLPLGIGIAMGFMGYAVAKIFIGIPFAPPLIGVVAFAYGILLTDLLLPVVSAALGGVLLYDITLSFGMAPEQMLLFAAAVTATGAIVQILLPKRWGFFGRRHPNLSQRSRGSLRSRQR